MLAAADHVPGSYSSTEVPSVTDPPATSTLPFGSSVAVCPSRDTDMVPPSVHASAAGSYSSAEGVPPPAIRTVPSVNRVAVPSVRPVDMLAAADQFPVEGSNREAPRYTVPAPSNPPATSTEPSGSRVAVGDSPPGPAAPPETMVPPLDQESVAGSYCSAVPRGCEQSPPLHPPAAFNPPAMITVPSGRRVAVWSARGTDMKPAEAQESVAGSYSSAVLDATGSPATPPPVTSTFPFGRRVAVAPVLAVAMDAAADQNPGSGAAWVAGAMETRAAAARASVAIQARAATPQRPRRLDDRCLTASAFVLGVRRLHSWCAGLSVR